MERRVATEAHFRAHAQLGFIMPINKRLYSLLESANKGVPVDDSEVDGLFQQWTRLHLVRVSSLAVACASAVLAFTL